MKHELSITTDGATKANQLGYSKPNEDYYLVDDRQRIYILLDGVSRDKNGGEYPNPSPSRLVSELFANTVYKCLKSWNKEGDVSSVLRQAAIEGNEAVKEYNRCCKWDFLPGTVGIVSVVVDMTFHYVYTGDCSIRLVRGDEVHLLTVAQTKLVHEHKDEFTADEIRNDIANNPTHPYGYGVFNGNRDTLHFLEYAHQAVLEGDVIVLASDGLDILLNQIGFHSTHIPSAQELIYQAEALEVENPNRRSDDKTVVILRIE